MEDGKTEEGWAPLPLPCPPSMGAGSRDSGASFSEASISPKNGKVPNSLDAQRPGPLMTHICQRVCLVLGGGGGGGQFSIGPQGHAWLHMAQMWHVVQGMTAADGRDSLY